MPWKIRIVYLGWQMDYCEQGWLLVCSKRAYCFNNWRWRRSTHFMVKTFKNIAISAFIPGELLAFGRQFHWCICFCIELGPMKQIAFYERIVIYFGEQTAFKNILVIINNFEMKLNKKINAGYPDEIFARIFSQNRKARCWVQEIFKKTLTQLSLFINAHNIIPYHTSLRVQLL